MTRTTRPQTPLRRRLVLAAAIAVMASAGAARAFADPVDLQVVDRQTGRALRLWRHDGHLFVAGQPGVRYGLRVTNHTDGRVLVVMSVDGVNVLTGDTAGYDQRGYVFDAHQSYDINGWRKSDTEVAAFTFASLPQSYAARTGRPENVGVLGIAVFKERPAVQVPAVTAPAPERRPGWPQLFSPGAARGAAPSPPTMAPPADIPPPPPIAIAPVERAAPAPSTAAAPSALAGALADSRRDDKLGTAHGAREWSVVDTTTFERATSRPFIVRQIEYDTRDNLIASGVIPASWGGELRPRPFPSNADGADYVPDPPPVF